MAVLDFGTTATAGRVSEAIAKQFNSDFALVDRDQSNAAANGVGYSGSLNLTIEEARNLASAVGCDFFLTGIAQTLRRSPSNTPVYFESYASLFLVSARTGKLVFWERQEFHRPTASEAEQALLNSFSAATTRERYQSTIRRIAEEERNFRATAIDRSAPVIELMPDVEAGSGVRAPRPFRRPKPPYPDAAAHDQVEATVDVLVDIDARGKVGQIEIARWAGYGLDESVVNTVKQMDFFPALRDGVAIPMRVLLRYNFRKPPQQ
jgi:TonB family protein